MGNTLSFVDVLKDTHAENQREKLSALEMKCGARKLLLSNPMMDVVYMTENELLLVKGDLLPSDKPTESWPTRNPIMMTHLCIFFDSSHRKSPLYALRWAQAFYSSFFPDPSFSFRLQLICLHIFINYESAVS